MGRAGKHGWVLSGCGLHCKALSPQSRQNQGSIMDLKEARGDSALKVGVEKKIFLAFSSRNSSHYLTIKMTTLVLHI